MDGGADGIRFIMGLPGPSATPRAGYGDAGSGRFFTTSGLVPSPGTSASAAERLAVRAWGRLKAAAEIVRGPPAPPPLGEMGEEKDECEPVVLSDGRL